MSLASRAGRWLLDSGIIAPNGGVARHRRIDLGKNSPVSTEITGYTVSALLYLHARTGDDAYRDAALKSADFLLESAWDHRSATFPFEIDAPYAYFFDLGIIIRALLAAWRATSNDDYRKRAVEAGFSLAFDFLGEGVYHPIISLPEKSQVPYEKRWAREPGCFQLKSAMAWHDLGDEYAEKLFDRFFDWSLSVHDRFLPGSEELEKVMDRLHAYCYFLEGLLAKTSDPRTAAAFSSGLAKATALHREILQLFERSDVAAQLLRARLAAHHLGIVKLDRTAAEFEVARIESFYEEGNGFLFGRKADSPLPYSNPVSTAFCLQALEMWDDHCSGDWTFDLTQLI